ncbi:phage tail tape measure protein [Novosphingobium sp.]|uniref:phage tail tape measure protein n=1 Tax=Novosphingobium sp. TaxID=1874826 RepID=UPI002FD94162
MATADEVVVRLRADTGDYEARMQSAASATVRATDTIQKGTERAAYAGRQMGRQFADVGAQLGGGQSLFTVVAQQAPQLADAMSDLGGKAGAVASFFSGPWGAALLAAASVVGTLTASLLADDEASQKHEKSAKSLADAIRDMEQATKGAIQTSQQAEQQHYNEAGALLVKAQNSRKATVALLEAARARLETADKQANAQGDPEGGVNFGITAGATQEREIKRLTSAIAEQNREIATQGENVRRAGIPMLQRQAAEATDRATAATGRYDRALGRLNQRFEAGTITPAEYRSQLEGLNRTRDREVEAANKSEKATKKDGDAKREAAKKVRELAAAQRELEAALDRILPKYDPARAAVREYGKIFDDINLAEKKGQISQADALSFRMQAGVDQAKAVAEAAWKNQEQRWIDVGFNAGDFDGSNVQKQINQELELRQEANDRIADDFRHKQEAQIRTLSTLYEDLFRGGTDAIWKDFKQIGFRIIAETLARLTMSQLGGGGGGSFGSILGSAVTSVLGFASGGSMQIGGRGGTDTNVLSLNGRQIANVSRGETLSVGSKALKASGRGSTVVQHISVDARGAVMNDQFAQMILAKANQSAAQMVGTGMATVNKNIPSRIAQYQRDGV